MRASVVVRTKDEAERLRLTLESLAAQPALDEVVVVNDGSSDATPGVLAEAAARLPLTVVTHASARGRCAASNAGARAASGDILLFLDGDTLLSPGAVKAHVDVHARAPRGAASAIGRGLKFHFRGTRFFQDPETGSPRAGEEARVARLAPGELERARVTRAMIRDDFDRLAARAEHGIYPGAGPRRLQELEEDALRRHPACTVLWAANVGSNFSVRRDAFFDAGGFDDAIDNNEHRELALRMGERGARMAIVEGAGSYHLTHRVGWRDPLVEADWEAVFWRRHPIPAVKLLAVFWASIGAPQRVPAHARIESLPALEAAARDSRGVDYDAIRRSMGLPGLPDVAALPR